MSFFSEAGGEIKKIPWWGWAGGAVALLLFGSHLLNRNQPDASAAADSGVGDIGDIGSPGPDGGGPPSGGSGGSGGSGVGSTGGSGGSGGKGGGGTTTQQYQTYTVKSGDTLYGIASKFHVDEPALYALNASVIEATAKSHNFSSSDHGHWIFPGEVLKIPK